ncbi:MAG: hypothetical protein ACOC93_06330 [Planctomycetota bacterium]
MTDLLRQGSDWLEQMRRSHCSSPVTYRRGGTELTLSATFGRTEMDVADDYGGTIRTHVTDFLIAAADLARTFAEPQAGDEILTEGVVHEVMPLAGQGCWRWSDPHRITMRVHTKEAGTATI